MRNNSFITRELFFTGFIALSVFLLLSGCSQQKTPDGQSKSNCLKPDSINPNGTSELAKLMRDMHVHAARLRYSIINGRPIDTFPISFEKMYTAKATDPKVRSVAFDGFTDSYLTGLKNIYSAKEDERRHTFNVMVDRCITCHNQYCTGPVKTINKLKVSETGL